jgi:ATP-dependent protease ClpP protease subunit
VRDINRDYWMNAQEALAYGIIDTVVGETEKRSPRTAPNALSATAGS